MKRIVLSLITCLASASAGATSLHPDTFAAPATFSGRVVVEKRMCVTTPCYNGVYLVPNGSDNRLPIDGPFRADLEAFDGQLVTAKGMNRIGGFKVEEFAPGKSPSFITGKVVDVTNCPPNAFCAPKMAIETAGGVTYDVADDAMAMNLAGLVGATVTLRGEYKNQPLGPMLPAFKTVFQPNKKANVMVRGKLSPLFHIMAGGVQPMIYLPGHEWPRYGLDFGNGTLPVYSSKNWWNRNEMTVWVSGTFDGGKFRSKKASRGFAEELPWMPTPLATEGSNVARGDATTGIPQSGAASAATGGGQRR